MQVNQWLTWLETAEEEESEEEDYWGTGQSHVFITMQWKTFCFVLCFLFFLSCVRVLMCPPSPLTPSPSPTSLVYIQYIYIFQPLLQFSLLRHNSPNQASITSINVFMLLLIIIFKSYLMSCMRCWIMFSRTVGSIVQEAVPSPRPDTFLSPWHLVGVMKCCHIDLKTVYKTEKNNSMQRQLLSLFNLTLLISF